MTQSSDLKAPLPDYCSGEKYLFEWNARSWNWNCKACNKVATQEHCETDRHMKNALYYPQAKFTEPSDWRPFIDAWTQTGMSAWTQTVRKSGYLTPATIVAICGGPDKNDPMPPPPIKFLCDVSKRPPYAYVTRFFGKDAFLNLEKKAAETALTHRAIRPFADAKTVLHAVVYTDCEPKHIVEPLKEGDDWGMWFPVLAIKGNEGYFTWCLAAAAEGWTRGWKTDGSRLHIYWRRTTPPDHAFGKDFTTMVAIQKQTIAFAKKQQTGEGELESEATDFFLKGIDNQHLAHQIFQGALAHPSSKNNSEWTPGKHFGACGQNCSCCREAAKQCFGGCEFCANTAALGVASRACKKAVELYLGRFGSPRTDSRMPSTDSQPADVQCVGTKDEHRFDLHTMD